MQHLTAASRISIHAPTRGATQRLLLKNMQKKFQSTLLQEERQEQENRKRGNKKFQSTLLQEERRNKPDVKRWQILFQSTLLQEERQITQSQRTTRAKFQSTLLQEERHSEYIWTDYRGTISIHAPTRGATFRQ